jgi:hypothetical protein
VAPNFEVSVLILHLYNIKLYRTGQDLRAPGGCKVVSPTHWPPLPPGNIPGTHFCKRLDPRARIKSMKNLNDPIGSRTVTLPLVVPEPTARGGTARTEYRGHLVRNGWYKITNIDNICILWFL